MFDWNDPAAVEFAESVFQSAAANADLFGLACDDPKIATRIQRADWVVAFFKDASLPNGAGLMPIKGLHDMGAGDGERLVRCVTIPCVDESAARRLQSMYGDPDWGMNALPQ